AGVVLLHVFLPQLFRHVQLLADDRRFHDDSAAIVAIGLLAYLAEGAAEIDEAEAPLARFLTGLPPDVPLPRRVELPAAAIVAADALLDAAIAHWDRIGATSATGLREAFLTRPGMLRMGDDGGARLRLERRGFDMLLDSLPWSISIVRLPWMTGPLYVDWR
ncbi:MAG: contractile injection system tape measure protein, partial [Alphaproteobacteria bacterium]